MVSCRNIPIIALKVPIAQSKRAILIGDCGTRTSSSVPSCELRSCAWIDSLVDLETGAEPESAGS